jgi:hypothetical protein
MIPAARTFLRYGEYLMGRIRWAASLPGRAATGMLSLLTDTVAEGVQQAFYSKLPGHPHMANDTLDIAGAERDLIRYPGETRASWAARVQGAWDAYEQSPSSFAVIQGVQDWGNAMFPDTWDDNPVLTEHGWARFAVTIPYGNTDWGPAIEYGDPVVYGETNAVYGISNAEAVDVALLRRTVRKWKPSRSKASIRVVLSPGYFYGDGSHTYGDGSVYQTTEFADLTV